MFGAGLILGLGLGCNCNRSCCRNRCSGYNTQYNRYHGHSRCGCNRCNVSCRYERGYEYDRYEYRSQDCGCRRGY